MLINILEGNDIAGIKYLYYPRLAPVYLPPCRCVSPQKITLPAHA